MPRILLSIVFLFSLSFSGLATHNRAGEITYRHLGGLTYEFTITTCTKHDSPADRDFLEIDYGDGTGIDSVDRVETVVLSENESQLNTYVAIHTYSGPGTFVISMEDPNRNSGVINIPNSVNQVFCIQSRLVISPFLGVNNSVQLDNPAKDNACINRTWTHNPGAWDLDGDSLSFSLMDCLGEQCMPIFNYKLPHVSQGSGTFTIDPLNGTVTWNNPTLIGEFNIAILIKEYRNGILVGSVIRDMQITVRSCSNEPPDIHIPSDTCVEAGTTLNLDITATDENGNMMDIEGYGAPFNQLLASPAILSPTFMIGGVANATFTWNSDCEHVALAPYATTFRVQDNGPDVDLSDAGTIYITVVAPAPDNIIAIPNGNSIDLTWDQSLCTNATGYKIYRRYGGPYGYVHGHCETGVPDYTGYQLAGTTSGLTATSFSDGIDLVHGEEYCYMVVTCFADGAESYASEEVCARLNLDLPIITNVDVVATGNTTGDVYVRWFNPIELDTVMQHTGPYHYVVYRTDGFGDPVAVVYTTAISNQLYLTDVDFNDTGSDTESQPCSYKAVLYSNDNLVGETHTASSVFLQAIPNDNRIDLSWTTNVPWLNDSFEVYRQFPAQTGSFTFVGISTTHAFSDTGLINRREYCYYVRSVGSYSDPAIYTPLLNRSQIVCASPTDLTPPCPPELSIGGGCAIGENYLSWTNPNHSCADDVVAYNLYYSQTDTGGFNLIGQFNAASDTFFTHSNNGSIAGCYAVTALDSINPDFDVANESDSSNVVCIDNCPEYLLPNVFSPNDDGVNDTFHPFPYRFVKDVDMTIFNRWGGEVYRTTDPDIKWDGRHQDTQRLVSDGVYYYVCMVNTIRLSGIDPVLLKGYVQVFSGDSNNPE